MSEPVEGRDEVWGVRPLVLVAGGVLTLALAGWFVLTRTPEDRVVAGTAAIAALIGTVCALPARRRLAADAQGFTLRGPGGARRVAWSQVVAIQAPLRRRRGLSSTSVEIDMDDDGLVVLGRLELGADPADVAARLRALWAASRPRWPHR